MSVSETRKPTRRRPLDPRQLPAAGTISASCRLSDYLLLLVCSLGLPARARAGFWRVHDGSWSKLDATLVPVALASGGGSIANDALLFVREPRLGTGLPTGSIVMRARDGDVALEPDDVRATFADVATIASRQLTPAEPERWPELLSALLEGTANERRARRRLSDSLFEIREIVRRPLPTAVVDPVEPRAAQVDAIWRLDDRAFYLEGWIKTEGGELTSLVAMSPEGERVELVESAFRYARSDVADFYSTHGEERAKPSGFIACFELRHPSVREDGWILEVRDSDGAAMEVRMPPVLQDEASARSTILADFALEPLGEQELKRRHIAPALSHLEARRLRDVELDTVDQHGVPPPDPIVSIIVPLYRRVEFLEHQLAQFVHDAEIAASDLVYVLDSPEDGPYLRELAHQLHRLYRIPFRLAVLTRNGGFSAVNNLGASLARGRLLLLLNSDVLPERPGWLGEMVRFYDGTPAIGALSPKLLYEDESIQHAGIYFDRPAGGHVWSNEHFFKGLHRDLAAANESRPVPAVTGACLLVSKELYETVGGLRATYIQGDYEDSDLCLRLAQLGRSSWYLASVALYHLEGQSYPSSERELVSNYNKWLHTSQWNEEIVRLVRGQGDTS